LGRFGRDFSLTEDFGEATHLSALDKRRRGRKFLSTEELDFDLWLVLALFIFFLYFALDTIKTIDQFSRYIFYGMLMLASLVILWKSMIQHGMPRATRFTPDWDNNHKWIDIPIVCISTVAILFLNAFVLGAWQFSLFPSLLMPNVNLTLLQVLPLPVVNFIQTILWQGTAVGGGEELMKLAGIVILTRRLKNEWLGAGISIGFWAAGHSMIAYGGAPAPVLGAFLAGCLLYLQLRVTGNILVCVFTHAAVNTIALLPTIAGTTSTFITTSAAAIPIILFFSLWGFIARRRHVSSGQPMSDILCRPPPFRATPTCAISSQPTLSRTKLSRSNPLCLNRSRDANLGFSS
jgi:hypothetical protein